MKNFFGEIGRDLRFALRGLNKDRKFTLMAVLALALGIGSVTVIFSAIYGVVIDTFPYVHFDRMVSFSIDPIKGQSSGFGREYLSIPEFLDYRKDNNVFSDMEGGTIIPALHWTHGGQTTQWTDTDETANGYQFFGVKPLIGRLITPADTAPGAQPVFMMTYAVWKNQFNSDPKIVGKMFDLNGTPYQLIAIMPPRFRPGWTDIFIAFPMDRAAVANDPNLRDNAVWPLGMLKPGVTIQQAAANLNIVAHQLAKAYPNQYPKNFRVTARSFQDRVTPMFTHILPPLLGAVALLLLIACTNVANLLLSRATARDREIAVRASMGASRWRLIRQLLTESFVLAVAGCVAGCFFAWLGIRELVPLIPYNSFPQESVIKLNGIVLAASLGIAFVATILCGLVPAIHAVVGPLHPRLSGAGTGSAAGLRHAKLRSGLVVAEIGLAIVLVTGAGLMLRSFFTMTHQDLGYDPKSVLDLSMSFPGNQYHSAAQRKTFFQELLTKTRQMPGVLYASPQGGAFTAIDVTGGESHSEPWRSVVALVGDGYVGIHNQHLLRGRTLSAEDVFAGRKVAVVNQAFAQKFLPKSEPLGQKVDFAAYDMYLRRSAMQKTANASTDAKPPAHSWFEVVGIVSDQKSPYFGRGNAPPRPEAFAPWTLMPEMVGGLSVRTSGNADRYSKALVQQIWSMDPDVETGDSQSGQTVSEADQLSENLYAQPEFEFIMLSTFAVVGLLLVMIGVYSVMAYHVSLQTHETGIRIALGAQRGDILRGVLRRGGILILCGVGVGAFSAWGATRLIRNELWHVNPTDPWTFAGAILIVILTGLFACLGPARRATEVDPLTALRHE
jgi:putative ABC transport system permease protein